VGGCRAWTPEGRPGGRETWAVAGSMTRPPSAPAPPALQTFRIGGGPVRPRPRDPHRAAGGAPRPQRRRQVDHREDADRHAAAQRGTAEVFGLDVVRDPVAVKRLVGYVPESGAVFETLTGWEYLQLIAALYGLSDGEAAARIVRFAEFFELAEAMLRSELLAAYSKGMRQRVVIAGALLHNPKAIFFDEPLNGLDANAALAFKT